MNNNKHLHGRTVLFAYIKPKNKVWLKKAAKLSGEGVDMSKVIDRLIDYAKSKKKNTFKAAA